MSADATLAELAALGGVFPEYTDMQRTIRKTSPDTQKALLRADGLLVDTDKDVANTLAELQNEQATRYLPKDVIVQTGEPCVFSLRAKASWVVFDEYTDDVIAEGSAGNELDLPELPMGVHRLVLESPDGEQESNLIVAPPRAPLLPELTGQETIWGVVASLYGLSGARSNEVGDYADLADLARAVGAAGASFLGINPVHAIGWAAPETISPYSPTHRGFLNTSHIALDTQEANDRFQKDALLDYARHTHAHRVGLEAAFDKRHITDDLDAFASFCAAGGDPLHEFACFETLSENHGPDWRDWPASLKTGHVTQADAARVEFHKWLQWRAAEQLGRASTAAKDSGMNLGLYLDLAVGARLGGAESWGSGSAAATGVALGAPPDQLSPAGQNWQLAALSPRRLRQQGYRALRQIIASSLQHCKVLRIDHALGLNRSFWIPEDGSPGAYIRQPIEALVAVISIEAARANAVIVGEDLGLVPKGFRERMAEAGFYGYTVMQYDKDENGDLKDTSQVRPLSLACFGTHDTPTLQGYWSGRDIDWWHKLDWIDETDETAARAARKTEKSQLIGVTHKDSVEKYSPEEVRDLVHAKLGGTPAAMVAVQLDDVLSVVEAQNLPGTVEDHPNWQRRYPASIDQIANSDALKRTADIMAANGRACRGSNTGKEGK